MSKELVEKLDAVMKRVNDPWADAADLAVACVRFLRENHAELRAALSAAAGAGEMRKVIEKLPHTKDGVPIVPGMKLYAGQSARCWAGPILPYDEQQPNSSLWEQMYSTQSAAQAAASGKETK